MPRGECIRSVSNPMKPEEARANKAGRQSKAKQSEAKKRKRKARAK